MHRFSHFSGVRYGRQRSPTIAVEVEILNILPKNANKLVSNGQKGLNDMPILLYPKVCSIFHRF